MPMGRFGYVVEILSRVLSSECMNTFFVVAEDIFPGILLEPVQVELQ